MTVKTLPADDQDLAIALAHLGEIGGGLSAVLSRLNALAIAANRSGDDPLDRQLTRAAVRLSRKNLAIAEARNKAARAKSLAGPITSLSGLAGEARQAVRSLESVKDALAAAARIVSIIDRLIGVFA